MVLGSEEVVGVVFVEDRLVPPEGRFDDVVGEDPPASRDGGGVAVFDPGQVSVDELTDAHAPAAVGEPDALGEESESGVGLFGGPGERSQRRR